MGSTRPANTCLLLSGTWRVHVEPSELCSDDFSAHVSTRFSSMCMHTSMHSEALIVGSVSRTYCE